MLSLCRCLDIHYVHQVFQRVVNLKEDTQSWLSSDKLYWQSVIEVIGQVFRLADLLVHQVSGYKDSCYIICENKLKEIQFEKWTPANMLKWLIYNY